MSSTGSILSGLLVSTLLGSATATPSYAADCGTGYGDFDGSGDLDGRW